MASIDTLWLSSILAVCTIGLAGTEVVAGIVVAGHFAFETCLLL